MKKQTYTLIIGIILAVFGLYAKNHSITTPKSQVSGASSFVQYDKTIKAEPGKPIKVARVVDGDTIVLINGESLRYIGIDTPEEVDPRKPVQCFAQAAAARNKELVEGQTITFQKDVSTTDKYGRWLGFVYLADGTFINEKLVKEGYAFAYPYPPDISRSEQLRQAEEFARNNKLGLWGSCNVNTLSTGREQTNTVQ